MKRIEMELQSIRVSIEAYRNILKNSDLSEEQKKNINEKINLLGKYRDDVLKEINDYDL